MGDLPADWHNAGRPARAPLDFFVGGDGADRWDVFQVRDSADGILDLTGCTIEAEIRTDADDLVAALTAEFTDITTASIRVSSTAAANSAMGAPCDAPYLGGKMRLGRYSVFITDSVGRWPIKAGDAFGIRA